jgi:hypothetical protein
VLGRSTNVPSLLCDVQMIRVFVESVLRYGLPVNFVVVMYRVRDDGNSIFSL